MPKSSIESPTPSSARRSSTAVERPESAMRKFSVSSSFRKDAGTCQRSSISAT